MISHCDVDPDTFVAYFSNGIKDDSPWYDQVTVISFANAIEKVRRGDWSARAFLLKKGSADIDEVEIGLILADYGFFSSVNDEMVSEVIPEEKLTEISRLINKITRESGKFYSIDYASEIDLVDLQKAWAEEHDSMFHLSSVCKIMDAIKHVMGRFTEDDLNRLTDMIKERM